MEEFAELLLPVTDPRHQTVEQLVQLLAERNKDIPEVSDVPWSVHVVDSPNINAFVLPVSKRKDVGKMRGKGGRIWNPKHSRHSPDQTSENQLIST